MAPPPAKKRRLAVAAAGVVTRRTTTRSQKPRLSAELLARVASYSSLGRDLLNLCVVAGPEDCALIRHAYLRNNFGYLNKSLRSSVGGGPWGSRSDQDWKTCRDRYRAWMAVNTDWRKYVTNERVERLTRAFFKTREGNFFVACHPFIPLSNPAVAIELGLEEVLLYFVEEKGIDVNSYRWSNFQYVTENQVPYHLLVACMACKNIEAFRYLLGRKDIDINSYSTETHDDCWMSHWTFMEVALDMRCCTDFVRELLAHPSFDIVASFTHNDYPNSPLHFAIDILEKDDPISLPTWTANFRLLLSAGADPYMEFGGLDAIQYADKLLREIHPLRVRVGKLWKDLDSKLHSKISGLIDAVEILEDWVAIK